MKWFATVWNEHGERLIFSFFALALAALFWFMPNMKGEAKTIMIGIAMLFFNKARTGVVGRKNGSGSDGGQQ